MPLSTTCRSGTLTPAVVRKETLDATTDGVQIINLGNDGRLIWVSFDPAITPAPNVDNCYPIAGAQVFPSKYGKQDVWLYADAALIYSVQVRPS